MSSAIEVLKIAYNNPQLKDGSDESKQIKDALGDAIVALEKQERLLKRANEMIERLEKDLKIADEQNDHDLEGEAIAHHTKLLLYAWQDVKGFLERVGEQK